MARRKPANRKTGQTPAGRAPSSGTGELRIIGGDWRSRKLRFPDAGGVRPSPARTRETLFNWLNFQIAGSDCLDLFAGSGALGLEALSRGAASTTLVDHTPALASALRDNLRLLKSDKGVVVCQDAESYLANRQRPPFDIVFMDPPFRQGWLERLFPLLETGQWIKPGGWVYVEHESERATPPVPAGWMLHRQKTAGQVTYSLYRVNPETD
ncbi:MAG: 16S rRNA (guanine(966)-N(2))-methyltransferase RsmD [Marinobacter sp.]|uniref:16S rRNA (guanine(966)-N(2))-methyltransferase RsmD n=1 Tax=Marinobacter sp. TaxID=50741 RepID=UPI0029C10938|nr:16S rRNA (guanine(966)-N(2))-methyltransferase RsmD [Marinobacter sp.]MDX5336895.1 16S rRNA (guanine(966)-N(2))-methyltransferase RsmD [Marinobacter sp.]MDX5388067.1 16S rRNA (guanine(966)-N(2))-methyltransferase RsmD [Marinobacter sp.]MDX5473365.1 16S rRNA (guanine(966)-N(2))-methyltransferase RsmD [Marinobacter sp.]